MIDLGTVRPGSTIRIPFSSFDKDDGSSITMTNYAAADILIYKDGSTTERASTAGFTATTDFDSKTGKHLAIIDLADNTTSGFYNAGSEYLVAIDAVTVDAVTTGGWIARFRIGYAGAMFDTTIATLSTQTSFTLTAGPAEDDAINGCTVIIHDIASAVQCGMGIVSDYTGSTKTVTLAAGTTFTAAAGDNISIMFPQPLQPTVAGRTLDCSTGGEAGVDWANVGSPTTTVNLSGTTVKTATDVETDTADIQSRLPAALVSGRMSSDAVAISGSTTAADNVEANIGNLDAAVSSRGTSTLTQTQVTGGAYALNSASFAFNSALDLTTTQKASVTTAATAATPSVTVSDKTGFSLSSSGLAAVTTWTVAITGNITGNLSGTIGGITAACAAQFFTLNSTKTYADAVAGSVVAEIADNAGGSGLTVQDIVDGVFDEAAGAHTGIIPTYLNASVSSRLASASYTAPDNTSITAIKAKTDSLTFTVSGQVDSNVQYVNDVQIIGAGVPTTNPWRPA